MNIPLHQIENVLRAYKKSLISKKNSVSQKPENRFNEKKQMLRNKILMDIARRTANLKQQTGVFKPEAVNGPDTSEESRIEYNIIGPNGKAPHSIDLSDILNCPVDLATRDSLHTLMKKQIMEEAVRA